MHWAGPIQPAMASDSGVFVVDANGAKDNKKVEAIRLEMLVVHATTANKAVDPQVRPLMKYFRNYKFTGFSLLDSQTARLTDKSARTFNIEGRSNRYHHDGLAH